jgi:hypothetical protein
VAGRHFLRGLRRDGPGSRGPDRSRAGPPRLHARYDSDSVVAFRVCAVRRRLLVGVAAASARRHRLGRDLHAGTQGDRRPARGDGAVARGHLACGRCRDLRSRLLHYCRPGCRFGRTLGGVSARRRDRPERCLDCRGGDALSVGGPGIKGAVATVARFPAGAAQPHGHGLDRRVHRPHLGIIGAARLGRDVPRCGLRQPGRAVLASRSDRPLHDSGPCRLLSRSPATKPRSDGGGRASSPPR